MALQEDLKKIDMYIEQDTDKFKETYLWLKEQYTTPEERKEIDDYIEKVLTGVHQDIKENIKELTVKVQLAENAEILPLAYIARNYFNKTKNWLYQRINGNIVNGKPATFTEQEKEIFNMAIRDISKKIGSIQIV